MIKNRTLWSCSWYIVYPKIPNPKTPNNVPNAKAPARFTKLPVRYRHRKASWMRLISCVRLVGGDVRAGDRLEE